MNGPLLSSLMLSLLLTLALETGFFLLTGKRNKKDMLLVILVNIVTNPVVVLSYWLAMSYTKLDPTIVIAPLELAAVCVEGAYFKKYGQDFHRPYLFSVFANIFSFGIGFLLQRLV